MPAPNLIPAFRLRAKAQRRHLRTWGVRLGVYAAVLLIGCFVRLTGRGGTTELLAAQERQLAASVETHTKILQGLKGELGGAREKLSSVRLVGRQPDWGLLLRLVGDQLGENVVLENSSFRRVSENTGEAGKTRRVLFLDLGGIARGEKDVSDFILRLESNGLFSEVKHVNSNQRLFHGQKAFGFLLKCRLAASQGQEGSPK
ncbi:MAG: PilN domain-containing protein [Planctomycetota bacterium]|nr:PilN domain-containing protein [Planctomycetota bacterium]